MIKRSITDKFLDLSNSRKVVLITGARQVGKSTFVKDLKEEDREYITLDDMTIRNLAKTDPKLFLMNHQGKVIIDEVQYAPELFSYIKKEVDESNEKGRFWLTGSQKFSLMNNVSESLAGRVSILEMSSLSYNEKSNIPTNEFDPRNIKITNNIDPNSMFENIFNGGMPEYNVEKVDRNQFFEDYIQTYLERDVRQLTQVGDLNRFRKFMVAVAARTGEVLNYNSIAEDADIDATTAKRWLSILEASDIIYLLQPYSNNMLSRAIKNSKIIFMDTGLCAYLCGWSSKETLENAATSGQFLETYVISEIIKNIRNNKRTLNYKIFYYRDRDQKEVDLIFELDNVIYPFEIKKTGNSNKSMISNFNTLENRNVTVGSGGLLCFYPDIIPLDEKHKSYPISVIF